MRTLISTSYWIMEEDEEQSFVILKRTERVFASNLDIAVEEDRVRAVLATRHTRYGIVVDLRLAPPYLRPQSESTRRLLAAIVATFGRVAALHNDDDVIERLFRFMPKDVAETLSTASESSAVAFAKSAPSRGRDPRVDSDSIQRQRQGSDATRRSSRRVTR